MVPLDRDHTGEVHVVGVEGKRDDRQNEHLLRCAPSRRLAKPRDDEVVGVQRQVVAMLLCSTDGLDHDRFPSCRGAQFLPGEIAPIERGAIRELHPYLPLAAPGLFVSHVVYVHRSTDASRDNPCDTSADSSFARFPYFGSQYDRYSPSHSSLQKGSARPSISTIQIRRGTNRPQSAQLVTAVSCHVRWISSHLPTSFVPLRPRYKRPLDGCSIRQLPRVHCAVQRWRLHQRQSRRRG